MNSNHEPSQLLRQELFAQLAEPFVGDVLFDSLSDLVFFIKNGRGEYVVVNQTLVTRCGVENKLQLIGRTPLEVFPAPMGANYQTQDLALLQSGQPLLNELELHLYPSGSSGWCLTTKVSLLGRDGQRIGLVGMSRDLESPLKEGDDFRQVAAAIRHAKDHLAAAPTLDELANVAGLSPYQLDQRIRRVFHLTTGQLLLKFRIDLATQRLRDTITPLSQIALDCGYSDQSAFTRQFRTTIGLTPTEYRKSYQRSS